MFNLESFIGLGESENLIDKIDVFTSNINRTPEFQTNPRALEEFRYQHNKTSSIDAYDIDYSGRCYNNKKTEESEITPLTELDGSGNLFSFLDDITNENQYKDIIKLNKSPTIKILSDLEIENIISTKKNNYSGEILNSYRCLLKNEKNRALEVNSDQKIMFITGLYTDTEICEIIKSIEYNFTIRIIYCIRIWIKSRLLKHFLHHIDNKYFTLKSKLHNFLAKFILDNFLNKEYRIALELSSLKQTNKNLKNIFDINTSKLVDAFFSYIVEFSKKYSPLIFSLKCKMLDLNAINKKNGNDRILIETFILDVERLAEDKKYKIIFLLFPEINYLILHIKNKLVSFINFKQIFCVITFVVFKYSFLRENLLIDLKHLYFTENQDYLQSRLLCKFILNIRTLLYIVYCNVKRLISSIKYKKYMCLRLFFCFLRVEIPEISDCLDIDEHILLATNYEYDLSYLQIHLKKFKNSSKSLELVFIKNFSDPWSGNFTTSAKEFFFTLLKNSKEEYKSLDLKNLENRNILVGKFKKIKKEFYLEILQALQIT
ncbi:hypothetical protein TUBRATIS_24590 [Tubulinosema ratisbonensis]|uniref:Uncharacterized protein n=1 Tax=Tubulinosema ratisbonensis TaxID=291195 RepID=A0A437AIV9_9MICR|nr:hypothetical protein TUBRATIS_24590 [Tubulinosema ratisbonensis]